MTPYERLLCPVDFSDISRMALSWAAGLSKELSAELTVLHVIDKGPLAVGNLAAIPDIGPEIRHSAEKQMANWIGELGLDDTAARIEEGPPADVILDTARSTQADLVVMGTHGLSGLQKLLAGSITEKVLHRIDVPLLSFSPKTEWPAAPKTVLMAIDLGSESDAVVRHGVWLAEHYGARLLAVHVVPVPYVVLNDRTVERMTPAQLDGLKHALSSDAKERLSDLLPASVGVTMETIVPVGSAFESLREQVETKDVDLIVLGAGGHGKSGLGWLGSTCHKLVRSASCPVLIVR